MRNYGNKAAEWQQVWIGFDSLDQSAITWAFLKQAALKPNESEIVLTAARSFSEELYQQTLGATYFAKGEIEKAIGIYETLAGSSLNRLSYLSLARCYNALRHHAKTAEILESGFQYWSYDLEYVLESASAQFRIGNTAKANEYLKLVESHLAQEKIESEPLAREVEAAITGQHVERNVDRDIYDDEFIRRLWQTYLDEQENFTPTQSNTSYRLTALREAISNFLTSRSDIQTVIDFGVMNGLVIDQLAAQFPDVEFTGCDRQPLIKELNSDHYSRPNLVFADGDIIDYIVSNAGKHKTGMMYHCFTSVFTYPDFLRKLYKSCAEGGIKYISLMEPCSFNHNACRFDSFEEMAEVSQPMRGHLILHNYPRLLREAGYEIVDMQYSFASLITPPIKLLGDNNVIIFAQLK